jgi:hypothetical protein
MGGRAVECTGLEIRQSRKRFVGSNPTPSANLSFIFESLAQIMAALPPFDPPSDKASGGSRTELTLIRRQLKIQRIKQTLNVSAKLPNV